VVEHEIQTVDEVGAEALAAEVDALKLDHWRLVQILCVAGEDSYELDYSFGGGYAMRTLRVTVGARDPVPSITPFYPAAFLYENEIRDLFGVRIERIGLDWEGKVYDVAKDRPFSKVKLHLSSSERPDDPLRVEGAPGAADGGPK
jgi:ech hydrogenase subunit D